MEVLALNTKHASVQGGGLDIIALHVRLHIKSVFIIHTICMYNVYTVQYRYFTYLYLRTHVYLLILYIYVYSPFAIFPAAICSLPCHNGGICIAPDKCNCSNGWTGSKCTTGMLIIQPNINTSHSPALLLMCTFVLMDGLELTILKRYMYNH